MTLIINSPLLAITASIWPKAFGFKTAFHFSSVRLHFRIRASETPNLREWLSEKPFTLACSSGFFGFYAQSGVISALCEQELFPSATRGSSTGALATALWAAEGFDYKGIGDVLSGISRSDFWDPSIGLGLLAGKRLESGLRQMLGDKAIKDCRVPVNISVFDLKSRETEIINSGDLTQAVHASIAIPPLFQPVKIDGRRKLDGGIKDHAGCYGAPKEERILHQNYRPRSYKITDRGYLNSQTLGLDNLPFVHPFSDSGLRMGMLAYRVAHSQTLRKLEEPVKSDPII